MRVSAYECMHSCGNTEERLLTILCKTPNEARHLPGTLEALRADGVQIAIKALAAQGFAA